MKFLELSEAQSYLLQGGIKYAREILEKTWVLNGQRSNEELLATTKVHALLVRRQTRPTGELH